MKEQDFNSLFFTLQALQSLPTTLLREIVEEMNAFIVFSNAHRDDVIAENPDASMTEVAKILGAMWRKLSDKEKAQYKDCGCS